MRRSLGAVRALDGRGSLCRAVHRCNNSEFSGLNAASFFVMSMCREGKLAEASRAFQSLDDKRNVVLWTAMISANAKFGDYSQALRLFWAMQLDGVQANSFTFGALLRKAEPIRMVRQIHSWVVQCGLESDPGVRKALIHAYGKCKSLVEARRVFFGSDVNELEVAQWTALISACARNGHLQEALELFRQMQQNGVLPDFVSFLPTLECCTSLRDARLLHCCLAERSYDKVLVVGNALMTVYAKCGSLDQARSVFDQLPRRDVVSWNTMLTALAQHSRVPDVLDLYDQMKTVGVVSTAITFVPVLEACCMSQDLLDRGRQVHKDLKQQGFERDTILSSVLIKMYARCGSLEEARLVFDKMVYKDVVVWTTLIKACSRYGYHRDAITLFHMMQLESVVPNRVTLVIVLKACTCMPSLSAGKLVHAWAQDRGMVDLPVGTAAVGMYGSCSNVDRARAVFEFHRCSGDTVLWNVMIETYSQNGRTSEALSMFGEMQVDGVVVVDITFVIVLAACSHAGLLLKACEYYGTMVVDYGIEPCQEHCGCVADLLGRAGRLDEAKGVIQEMGYDKHPVLWSCLLNACKVHGDAARGQGAAQAAAEEQCSAPYVMLSNIFCCDGDDETSSTSSQPMVNHSVDVAGA